MRISTRLILLLVTAVIAVMGVYALVTISRTRDRLTEELEKMAEHIGLALSVGTLHHLEAGDVKGVEDVVERISHHEDVAGAAVFDREGRLVAVSRSMAPLLKDEPQVYLDPGGRGWFEGEQGHRVYTYITGIQDARGQVIGSLRLALREQSMLPYVLQARNHLLITIAALTAVLAGLIVYVSQHQIARPLQALTQGAQAIGRGDLDFRIAVDGGGEVRALAVAFNRMAASLEAINREITAEREHILSIVNSLPEGVVVLDQAGHITAWNQSMAQRYGHTTKEVLGKKLAEVFPELKGTGFLARVERLLAGQVEELAIREMALAAAPDRILTAMGSPLRDAGNRSRGAVLVLVDTTERVRLERQIQQSEKLAAIGQLAAGLAHEIGTPLNVISGNAEYLLMETAEGDARTAELKAIVAEVARIADLVKRLMAFARHEVPRVEPLVMGDLIDSVLVLVRKQMDKQGIRVEVDLEAGVPPIAGDRDQLQQVLLNLVMNAWQSMPQGGALTLRGRRVSARPELDRVEGASSRWVELRVEDTGTGIPPGLLPKIFDPFFTTKEIGEGTGLGLAIVHQIVARHQGRVEVASQEGVGSAFAVVLPAAGGEDQDA